MTELSHTDSEGKARMVDVSRKPIQRRLARASGRIRTAAGTLELIRANAMAKGDVLGIARLAGIQAAKETPRLIPLCHPLIIDHIDVQAEMIDDGVSVTAEVVCAGRTGIEMEALTAVSVALLTIYDMCKAVDKEMVIEEVKLLEKVKEDV